MLAAYIQYKYIFQQIYNPQHCAQAKGRTETPTIHAAPKCRPDISNTHVYIQLTFIPQIVGCIYPITNLNFLNVKGILEGPVWSRNKAVQYICAYMPFLSFHHFEQCYVCLLYTSDAADE